MNIKNQLATALHAGANEDELLRVVGSLRLEGATQKDVYESLGELWLEYGFNDDDGGKNALRDALEYTLERVWYGTAIWPSGLRRGTDGSILE